MGELKIRRKGYWRGPYSFVRNGKQINVKKHWIPETTYLAEDKGKPGRTPEGNRWFDPKTHTGWEKTQEPSARRSKLLQATDEKMSMHDRYVRAGRMIQELANVTTDEATKQEARADAQYFFQKAKEA